MAGSAVLPAPIWISRRSPEATNPRQRHHRAMEGCYGRVRDCPTLAVCSPTQPRRSSCIYAGKSPETGWYPRAVTHWRISTHSSPSTISHTMCKSGKWAEQVWFTASLTPSISASCSGFSVSSSLRAIATVMQCSAADPATRECLTLSQPALSRRESPSLE